MDTFFDHCHFPFSTDRLIVHTSCRYGIENPAILFLCRNANLTHQKFRSALASKCLHSVLYSHLSFVFNIISMEEYSEEIFCCSQWIKNGKFEKVIQSEWLSCKCYLEHFYIIIFFMLYCVHRYAFNYRTTCCA